MSLNRILNTASADSGIILSALLSILIFYSYQYELNFLANHNDIDKFDMYHYTVLDYIKNDLGPNYKFRNYKISGPNFSKVDFFLKKIKNKNKTDYIKSKTAITFTIFSTGSASISSLDIFFIVPV